MIFGIFYCFCELKFYCQTHSLVHVTVSLLYRGVLYVEVILYSKECNWYTRCCPLGGVHYRECLLKRVYCINGVY